MLQCDYPEEYPSKEFLKEHLIVSAHHFEPVVEFEKTSVECTGDVSLEEAARRVAACDTDKALLKCVKELHRSSYSHEVPTPRVCVYVYVELLQEGDLHMEIVDAVTDVLSTVLTDDTWADYKIAICARSGQVGGKTIKSAKWLAGLSKGVMGIGQLSKPSITSDKRCVTKPYRLAQENSTRMEKAWLEGASVEVDDDKESNTELVEFTNRILFVDEMPEDWSLLVPEKLYVIAVGEWGPEFDTRDLAKEGKVARIHINSISSVTGCRIGEILFGDFRRRSQHLETALECLKELRTIVNNIRPMLPNASLGSYQTLEEFQAPFARYTLPPFECVHACACVHMNVCVFSDG